MKNLYPFQKEAIQTIVEFYNSCLQNAKINISTGLGIKNILVNSMEKILKTNNNCKILLLCSTHNQVTQYLADFMSCFKDLNIVDFFPNLKDNGIFITTYESILREAIGFDYNTFNLIICSDLGFLDDNYKYPFFSKSYKGKRLSITNSNEKTKLLENDKLIFQYNISNAIEDGFFTPVKEIEFLEDFLPFLLSQLGFTNIEADKRKKDYSIDMMATYHKKNYIFELKTYRTEYASSSLIENAAYMFSRAVGNLRETDCIPVMIVSCKVNASLKKTILDKTRIEIWDIANLLYLCNDSQSLIQKLSLYIPFPIFDIKPEKTLLYENDSQPIIEPKSESQYQKFEELLNNCKPGKDDDTKYEEICSDIIKYLFETEFFQMSKQHKTGDNLFRMDLICSLKGTTEFWKFLMQFFNTKFVVFEFKNYSEELSQNLIFITSKYLYPAALRNVAFVVSRHGIDTNSETIITSKIKDERKLIISLTDKDLLIMVALKDEGKEPSDYLLEKVENLLMSLSI